uniref:Uncharacterized protein n=1 Tax=Oryza barthii TaxID=65489 RepID=A0A0D3H6W4_9ORYZ
MVPTPEIYPSALGLFAGRRWEAHGGREEMEAARWWRSRRIYDGDDLGTAKGEGRATRANELGKRPTGSGCGMMAAMTELCASVEDDVSEYTSNTNVFLPPPSLCDDELSHNLLHFLPFSSLPSPSLCEDELRHNLLPFYHRWPSPPSPPSANALKDGGRATSAPTATSGDGRRERVDGAEGSAVGRSQRRRTGEREGERCGQMERGKGATKEECEEDQSSRHRGRIGNTIPVALWVGTTGRATSPYVCSLIIEAPNDAAAVAKTATFSAPLLAHRADARAGLGNTPGALADYDAARAHDRPGIPRCGPAGPRPYLRTASLIYTLSTSEELEDERPIMDMARFRQEMEVIDDGTAMPMDSAPNSSLDVDKILKVPDVNCLTEDGVPVCHYRWP